MSKREDIKEAAQQMAQLFNQQIEATTEPPAWAVAASELRPELSLEDKRRKLYEWSCLYEMAAELERRAKNDWADAESMCLFLAGRCRARGAEIVHELGGQAALGPLMDALGWD